MTQNGKPIPYLSKNASDSYLRINMRLGLGAGMGDRALFGGADLLSVFPQRAGLEIMLPGLPGAAALFQFRIR